MIDIDLVPHQYSSAQLKVYGTCEIVGWAGGGGVSGTRAGLDSCIWLKCFKFNKAGLACLTGYAAGLTPRIEYKPAARGQSGRPAPVRAPHHAGPLPSSLVQRTTNTTATAV